MYQQTFILDFMFGIFLVLPHLLTAQIRHPQELDMSDVEGDDSELLNWSVKKTNNIDCSLYYRRLVKHLFSQKRFQPDPASDYYIASVPLRLNKEQWELLVNNNVRNSFK